jgi:divalent metal cation (Fe/Co/Zn/Cd) transporter
VQFRDQMVPQRFIPLPHSGWGVLGFVYQLALLIVALIAILGGAPGVDGVIAVFVTALIGVLLYLALMLYNVMYRAVLVSTQALSPESFRVDQWHFLTGLIGNVVLLATAVIAWLALPPNAAQVEGLLAVVLSVATALVILTNPTWLPVRYMRSATGELVDDAAPRAEARAPLFQVSRGELMQSAQVSQSTFGTSAKHK